MEKQPIGGIVLTGGGSQLKHLSHLVEYLTGMNARIGYPNEHLAKSNGAGHQSAVRHGRGPGDEGLRPPGPQAAEGLRTGTPNPR